MTNEPQWSPLPFGAPAPATTGPRAIPPGGQRVSIAFRRTSPCNGDVQILPPPASPGLHCLSAHQPLQRLPNPETPGTGQSSPLPFGAPAPATVHRHPDHHGRGVSIAFRRTSPCNLIQSVIDRHDRVSPLPFGAPAPATEAYAEHVLAHRSPLPFGAPAPATPPAQ